MRIIESENEESGSLKTDKASLDRILLDWLVEEFGIFAYLRTEAVGNWKIDWRGKLEWGTDRHYYNVLEFDNKTIVVNGCPPYHSNFPTCWERSTYDIADPNLFEKLKPSVQKVIDCIRTRY